MTRIRIALLGLLALQSLTVQAGGELPPGMNGVGVGAGPLFVDHTSPFNDIRQTQSRFIIASLAVITVAVGASSAWALVERYRKNKAVESHKQDKQIIQDRQFLSELAMYIETVERKYSKGFEFLRNHANDDSENKDFVQHCLELFGGSDLSCVVSSIDRDLNEAIHKKHLFALKCSEWNGAMRNRHEQYARKLQEMVSLLRTARDVISQQKPYLHLTQLYSRLEDRYAKEMHLNTNAQSVVAHLDTHIRMRHSADVFCYPAYAERIRRDCGELETALQHASSQAIPFHIPLIDRSRNLLASLQNILGLVVTTQEYKKQNADKVVHDQKAQRLDMELSERQARIHQEYRLADARLQAEQNRARQLANEKAETLRQIQLIAQREVEVRLELARIRDHATIKDEFKKNNRQWEEKEKKNDEQWKAKLVKLQSQLQSIENGITYLQNLATRPPCNPDSIDGLRQYMNELLTRLQYAHNEIRHLHNEMRSH